MKNKEIKKKVEASSALNCLCMDCIRKDGVIEYLMEKCASLEERITYSYNNGLTDQKGCKIIPLDPNYENVLAVLTNFKPCDKN
jgi:hypothetical protein